MALAEKSLAAEFNRPGHEIVDHYTYVFLGDGCLMEGISHEACSLAGTLKLGKLICLYDDNGISIDGGVDGWFTDDTPERFRAYGWHVVADVDGHDPEAIHAAIAEARANRDQPSLICCKTIIGFGAPNKQGTAATHGAPLGADEIAAAREMLGWSEPPFVIPEALADAWNATEAGRAAEGQWNERMDAYTAENPELAAEFNRRINGELPADWASVADAAIADIANAGESVATRKASLIALNAYAPALPELLGGSADLTGSNLTKHSGSSIIGGDDASGNYVFYGVREFAMAAIMNGLALHGGFIPYGGTFLTFSDYSRNALRMAALMGIRTIHVFTHDSIGLGEDGPTHQPVEQVASLQLIPNMRVWRPCDAVETAVAWRDAIETATGPTSLILTRQSLVHQSRTDEQRASIRRGAYVLCDASNPELILIATGSEVALAVTAAATLTAAGHRVRVVSMPCIAAFLAQDEVYRESVLPAAIDRRLAIEAGVTGLWYRFVGSAGQVIGLDRFGASAPAGELFKYFGFTSENIVAQALRLLEKD
jgi:transketolase